MLMPSTSNINRPISITVKDLTKVYKLQNGETLLANDSLSFVVHGGEIFGLLGPNGAGKTTLIRQMLGLSRPHSGSICIEGIDILADPNKAKRMIGFLPQSGIPMREVGIERALRYTGCLRGQTEKEARNQAAELIERFGLVEEAKHDVGKLSGGQLRLVNFGMALMSKPRMLILDEPTNELDPKNRRLVWDMLHELNSTRGVTVILVTHNVLEAERVVHRVGIMKKGKFLAIGRPGKIKSSFSNLIRVEFSLKEEEPDLTPEQLTSFAKLGRIEQVQNGYRIYVSADQINTSVSSILSQIGYSHLDDFRIAPSSLEDAYLAMEHSDGH